MLAMSLQLKTTIPLKAANSIFLLRVQEVTTLSLASSGLGLLTVWLQGTTLSFVAPHYIHIFINSTFIKQTLLKLAYFKCAICSCWDPTVNSDDNDDGDDVRL